MSSTPPDPAPTSVSSDVDAVVSGESLIVALAAFAAGAIETTELVAVERERAAAEERARARRELLGLRLEERLPTEIETVVYRVVQEALTTPGNGTVVLLEVSRG